MQEGKVQNVAVVRTTNVMTPVTQVLVPGHVAATGSVQMAKIAPATTALPTQLTTVLPASNITSGVPVVQPAVTSTKTILPQTTLQQVQGHNVVINRANMQQLQMSGEVGKLHTYILYLVQWNLSSAGLSLRAGGRGFSPATKRVAPGYFYWKTEEKYNQKKSLAV